MRNNIYISTVAFSKEGITNIIDKAREEQLNIEFSSGLPFHENMVDIFLQAPLRKLPHNYFPAPLNPFVLNLASTEKEIREKSVKMCKNGILYAAAGKCNFYAAHAGFCIDPLPGELGGKIKVKSSYDKEAHWAIFKNSIFDILVLAEQNNINFLIENNVIIASNMMENGDNPLFCCTSSEILQLVSEINHPLFGILLDTAHLKVSCKTLGLDKHTEMQNLLPVIKAMHHSDNDSFADTNSKITTSYWCAKFLPQCKQLDHVIEVKNIAVEEIHEQENLLFNFF